LEKYEDLEDENTKCPWETEPNSLKFVDESTGYNCFIWRRPELKYLCGFVELPKEHKLYGKDFKTLYDDLYIIIDVHRGITYADSLDTRQNKIQLEDVDCVADYVIGFDCGFVGDFVPGAYVDYPTNIKDIYRDTKEVYRNIEYVINECIKLAKQLKELE
jgi:hypothetical protein